MTLPSSRYDDEPRDVTRFVWIVQECARHRAEQAAQRETQQLLKMHMTHERSKRLAELDVVTRRKRLPSDRGESQ